MLDRLQDLVNENGRLVEKGRFVTLVMMVGVGQDLHRVTIEKGRIASVETGPFVMPSYTFGIHASAEDWALFWSPAPPPRANDVMALLKDRRLRLEGDLHPFMA
ncbi:MAG: hypothetical protein K9H11_09080, partial [Rhodospirillum sp.]|nr:hypothetical protein [Rhodospirillum sp.]